MGHLPRYITKTTLSKLLIFSFSFSVEDSFVLVVLRLEWLKLLGDRLLHDAKLVFKLLSNEAFYFYLYWLNFFDLENSQES